MLAYPQDLPRLRVSRSARPSFVTNGAMGTKKRSLGKFNGYDVLSKDTPDVSCGVRFWALIRFQVSSI